MRKKVLIVEDNPATQKILVRMIHRIDQTAWVYGSTTAEAAFQTLKEATQEGEPFDVVVADLNLPCSDGLTLKEVVEKKGWGPDFLFISGVTFEEWDRRSKIHGSMPPLLRKPITYLELKEYWDSRFSNVGISS